MNNRKRSNADGPGQPADLSEPKRKKLNTEYLRQIFSHVSPSAFFSMTFAIFSLLYFWLTSSNPNNASRLKSVDQIAANQQKNKDLELHWKKYEDERNAFALEEQKEEEEQIKRIESQREKRQALFRSSAAEENAGLLERVRQRELEKREANEEFEKLRSDSKRTNYIKNQQSQYHLEQLDAQRELEKQEYERKLVEERRTNQEKLDDMNVKLASDRSRFQRQESLKRQVREEEERRFQQRMARIQEQQERELERMHLRNAQRKAEMDNQLREIYRELRNRVWNEIIENNWTNRLNTLRAANQDVTTAFRSMKANTGDDQNLEVYKKNLLAALSNESETMQHESTEISQMYKETNKSFLLEIKNAVDRVKYSCDLLSSKLNGRGTPGDLDKSFGELCQASTAIPTLAELKKHYREHMQ